MAIAAKKLGYNSISGMRNAFGLSLYNERQRKTGGKATATELQEILSQQGFKCALSGRKLEPATASIDHKIPVSKGGTDEASNLQWVDKRVNRMKGNMSDDEFIELCKEIATWKS